MAKSHLFFRNPSESTKFRQRSRFPAQKEDEKEEEVKTKDYSFMQNSFASSLSSFNRKRKEKASQRNSELNIPARIDYIVINFFDFFDSKKYELAYKNNFGLIPVSYDRFNTVGCFVIENEELFQSFISDIQSFINSKNISDETNISKLIFYIKSFLFLSKDEILQTQNEDGYYSLRLFDSLYLYNSFSDIRKSLLEYCQQFKILHVIDYSNNRIELFNISPIILDEIISNFDIIQSVSSMKSGIIRPSSFNTPIREYGFQISNSNEDLPVIGIIDTGVSSTTPLASIIINDGNEFDITDTSPKIDIANHGTGVAAIAALGKSLYDDHKGFIQADAKVLSIKVLDSLVGNISESKVVELITEANQKYGIKIFVLTLCKTTNLENNIVVSNYAASLDLLSSELDILIFISVGNYKYSHNYYDLSGRQTVFYPEQYLLDNYKICSPSDSMNNISCGAISSNLENQVNLFSLGDEFPASYTRLFNIDRNSEVFNSRFFSVHRTKPDICWYGGEYDKTNSIDHCGLKVLSTQSGIFYDREIGTSYSAPFAANLAAKLLKTYPELINNMQTVKALIMNSTYYPKFGKTFEKLNGLKKEDIIGYGIPEDSHCIYSDDNNVTLILEDEIKPGEIKAYSIRIPEYLAKEKQNQNVLKINVTLCFSFEPVPNNHFSYCPIHMSFGVFRNAPLFGYYKNEKGKKVYTGLSGGKLDDFNVLKSWSEDYYNKPKLLSNTQKLSFTISKEKLVSESNEFKLAVESRLHKLLPAHLARQLIKPHKFSVVISLIEKAYKGELLNKLYDELALINDLEVISQIEGDAEVNLEN